MPTLLELAGAEIPKGLDGRSLCPVMRGEQSDVREMFHGEHSGSYLGNHFIVTKRDKYIWFDESGTEQYFDLIQDPDELHDRIGDPACQDRIAKLRAELICRLAGRPEGYSDGEKLIPGRPQRAVL